MVCLFVPKPMLFHLNKTNRTVIADKGYAFDLFSEQTRPTGTHDFGWPEQGFPSILLPGSMPGQQLSTTAGGGF